ncbi:MAG: hypothetical protein ACD_8C00041G0002 [uncultured bacterium]|nr:MAG: hypothetical protein ACD_8C00041G0002 [uncultured bacterium]
MEKQINEFLEKIKDAEKQESQGQYFNAAFLYKDAIKIGRNSKNQTKLKYCKNKMIEMNLKSKKEYKQAGFTQKIDNKKIDTLIKNFFGKDGLDTILKKIGMESTFRPSCEKIKGMKVPVFTFLASTSVVSEDGHVVKGGEDSEKMWFSQMYSLDQDFVMAIYVEKMFLKLMSRKGVNRLNSKNLINYLENSKVFNDKNFSIIKRGIERYFARDYVSTMHILIPQFESVFLDISQKLGIDITKINDTEDISTEKKTLSQWNFEEERFIKAWGKDLCQQIKHVFFDPLGFKLRHKVAHGEIDINECNFRNATLMTYFYIVLASILKVNK